MTDVKLDDIVSLCKRRGFVFQGSEVYGGLAGTWDYGPLGVALKKNIMDLWWKTFVEDRDDMYGVDAAILMNKKVWEASGHTETFTDPFTICRNCNTRQRVDKIVEEKDYGKYVEDVFVGYLKQQEDFYNHRMSLIDEFGERNNKLKKTVEDGAKELDKLFASGAKLETFKPYLEEHIEKLKENSENYQLSANEYAKLQLFLDTLNNIREKLLDSMQYVGRYAQQYLNAKIPCPVCKYGIPKHFDTWLEPVRFNLMFKTQIGPVADNDSISYLRPETAQGIFTNYKNVVDTIYPDMPFGIAQQGKAFRNEISPRDFVFRSREFEQMEIEYFVEEKGWEKEFDKWVKDIEAFLSALGLPKDSYKKTKVSEADRAHYSNRTIDFEFKFPHGEDELLGLAYRTDFDLMNIQKASGKSMEYRPKDGGKPFVPHVIEPSFGVERAFMAVMTSAYWDDKANERVVLKLPAHLAPVKVAVSPLLKNKPELVKKAREVYDTLKKEYGAVMWDDNGNIGKRYRRQDEIGTPYCVTIDFDTLKDDTVTVRNRDTTKQDRIKIADLSKAIKL